jgi:hypothetical protein
LALILSWLLEGKLLSPKGKAKGTVQVPLPSSVVLSEMAVPVDTIEVKVVVSTVSL